MAIDRSSYQIDIKSTADIAGIEKSISAMTRMRDAAASAGKETAGWDDAINQAQSKLDAAKKPIEDAGEKLGELELSGHEARHAVHLLGEGLGEVSPQLGSIGTLASSASAGLAFLVPAATIEAVKMLTDRLNETKQALIDNIQKGMEISDMFEENLRMATLHANEHLESYRDTLAHVTDHQDRISRSLQNSTAILNENTDALISQAKAQRERTDALIQAGVAEGTTTGPQAARFEEEARKRERTQEEKARHDQAQLEIDMKRGAAAHADDESKKADAAAQAAINNKPVVDAAVKDATDLLARAKNELPALEGGLAAAKANGFAGQAVPEIRVGMSQGDLDRRNMIIKANEELKFYTDQVERQKAVIANGEKHLSDLTIEQAKNDANISRLSQRAEAMKELAEATKEAADQQERLEKSKESHQAQADAYQDETFNITRRKALEQKVNAGTATPDEQAEYAGATESGVGHAIRDTASRIGAIQNNIRFEGGHASAAEVQELILLNDRLLGLIENTHGVTAQNSTDIDALSRRCAQLESSARNYPGH